jgi:peptidoglycan biosynthesis protein MviN/MurJ (putative lipid II flippase)
LTVTSGIAAVASFLGYGITAAHVFRYQVWTILAAICTTGMASLLLVPRYHAMGAAISLMISALVQALIASAILSRALRIRPSVAPL